MSSQGDFPVNPSVWQGSDEARMTTVISGRKCCERFGKYVPAGSWVKMFSESLIGRTDWFSNRCALIWRLKASKSNRIYFQLAVSTRRISDTERGSSPMLLKTPAAIDAYANRLSKKEQRFGDSGSLAQEAVSGFIYERGLLPTVQTQGLKRCRDGRTEPLSLKLLPTPRASKTSGCDGSDFSPSLPGLLQQGLLPTPATHDWKGRTNPGVVKTGSGCKYGDTLSDAVMKMLPTPKANDYRSGMPNRVGTEHTQQLNDTVAFRAGTTSRLNPLFVEEMMGFPAGWILTPFLRDCPTNCVSAEAPQYGGERNPSNATATPSSRRSSTEF